MTFFHTFRKIKIISITTAAKPKRHAAAEDGEKYMTVYFARLKVAPSF